MAMNIVLIAPPLQTPQIRSLNLANAVAIAVYEGLRQLRS